MREKTVNEKSTSRCELRVLQTAKPVQKARYKNVRNVVNHQGGGRGMKGSKTNEVESLVV